MLKEEDFEKKRLAGTKDIRKRTSQLCDSDNPKKLLRTEIDNDQNTIYEIPTVCILSY